MARWQQRLKDNETKVRELTSSQQNLAAAKKSSPHKSKAATSTSGNSSSSNSSTEARMNGATTLPRSASSSDKLSVKSLSSDDKARFQTVPSELHQVCTKSCFYLL